jgi:hypothetical protein
MLFYGHGEFDVDVFAGCRAADPLDLYDLLDAAIRRLARLASRVDYE